MTTSDDVIVAPATPMGAGETAVVRLSGKGAAAIVERAFVADRGCKSPRETTRGTLSGRFYFGDSGASAVVGLHVQTGPRSFTGEDQIEIFVDAAPILVEGVVRTLVDCGARPADPGEFTRRAYQNGKIDLVQAEAVAALIRASTEAERRAALTLYDRGFSTALEALADRIAVLLVPVELAIDFSDQDVQIVDDRDVAEKISAIIAAIDGFADQKSRRGARADLPRIVLRGRANAGKSSLFNALAQKRAAIVMPVRGTTRDAITAEIRIGDRTALLVDTAGDDVADSPLDRLAQERRMREEERADLIVFVIDGREVGGEDPGARLVVRTHADLVPESARAARPGLWTSTVDGEGLERLRAAIHSALGGGDPGEASHLALNARHLDGLARARAALGRARDAVIGAFGLEYTAADLREALAAIKEITGADYAELVLDKIMRDFCIGK